PVLEILSCTQCGEAYIEGVWKGAHLSAPLRNPPRDEFAFDHGWEGDDAGTAEAEDTDENETGAGEDNQSERSPLFAANPTPAARNFWLDREDGWRVSDSPAEGGLTLLCEEFDSTTRSCPHCRQGGQTGKEVGQLRPLRFGAPFIVGNAAPILLEGVEPVSGSGEIRLPSGGRRLLSFTDSRQGTARMAAKLQVEAERNFVRSFIYHQVQASIKATPEAAEEVAKLETELNQLEAAYADPTMGGLVTMITERRGKLDKLNSGNTDGIAWPELVNRLAERVEVAEWILPVWSSRDDELFTNPHKVAEFLLLREFFRRPRRSNSIETLGLARLRNPAIDRLTPSQMPEAFQRRGKTIDDWRAFLEAVLTYFVRSNGGVAIDQRTQHWIAHKDRRRSLVGPDDETLGDKRLRAWPNGRQRANPRARPVAFLLQGLNLDLSLPSD